MKSDYFASKEKFYPKKVENAKRRFEPFPRTLKARTAKGRWGTKKKNWRAFLHLMADHGWFVQILPAGIEKCRLAFRVDGMATYKQTDEMKTKKLHTK